MEDIVEADSFFEEVVDDLLDASLSSNCLQEDSFDSSFLDRPGTSSAFPSTSTPLKKGGASRSTGRGRGKINNPPKNRSANRNTPRIKCDTCGEDYANERTFRVHKRMHTMKGAMSKAPSMDELKSSTLKLLKDILLDIQLEEQADGINVHSDYCSVLNEGLQESSGEVVDLLTESFHDVFRKQNALLPIAMRSAVLSGSNKLLSSTDFRNKFKSILCKIHIAAPDILNPIIGEIVFRLFQKLFVLILKIMRGSSGDESDNALGKRSEDKEDSDDFKQLVYYIAGSVIHGLIVKSQRYSSSPLWCAITNVLKARFLFDTVLENECHISVRVFTEERSRGGLLHCNQDAFNFFLVLFKMILQLEGPDGSLSLELVQDHLFQNDTLIFLWDELVGCDSCDLSQEQSLTLLSMIANSCARVVSKGIMKRRINEDVKQAYSSVSLRSRLAR